MKKQKIDKALAKINKNLNGSARGLKHLGKDLVVIAKATNSSLEQVALGAAELARQGLDSKTTISRLTDALILSRLAGLDTIKFIEKLTRKVKKHKS